MESPVPPTGNHPQDREAMMTDFAFADDELIDQLFDLLDPEQLDPGRLDPGAATSGAADWSSPASRGSPTPSGDREQLLLDTDGEAAHELDAAGRRKGGGPPQPLDGLTDRRRRQIIQRRNRNRESMRRMRARFKSTKEQLRDLELQLAHHRQRVNAGSEQAIVPVQGGEAMLIAAAKHKLLELQQVELQLAQEQQTLRTQLAAYQQSLQDFHGALRDHRQNAAGLQWDPHVAAMMNPEFLPSTLGGSLVRENDHAWVDRILPLLPQLSTISSPDGYEFMRQSYIEVVTASRDAEKFLAHTNNVLGWKDTRMVNGTWLDFVLRKEMASDDLETIVRRTWAMQTSGQSINEMMPQKHHMKILAKINDTTMVCARNLVYPGDPLNYCTIYLLMLVRNGDDGYVIVQRTLEPTDRSVLQELLGPNHSYVSVFYGLMLAPRTEVRDDGSTAVVPGCKVSFGGRVGNGTVKYASTWSMDVLVAILRWESACISPIFRLSCQDEDAP